MNYKIILLSPLAFCLNILLITVVSLITTYYLKKIKKLSYVVPLMYVFCLIFSNLAMISVGSLIEQKTEEMLLGYAPSYSEVFRLMGHESLNQETKNSDQNYLKMIELQKSWLLANPYITDIYTMKLNQNGKPYFIVDSETDYNKNGKIDGDREGRTSIGEVYEKELDELKSAFNGHPSFTKTPYSDKWGEWVSAFVPIRNSKNQTDGVLGIDFSSEVYLSEINQNMIIIYLFISLFYIFICYVYYTLQKSIYQAGELGRIKEQFTASISHEIRTPLNGIIGASRLLSETYLSKEQGEFSEIIQSCSKHLLDLINDVMDYSRIQSQELHLESVQFDLKLLLEDCIHVFKVQAQENKNILELEGISHSIWVVGDSTRLRQILINLIGNANKFTKEGQVIVRFDDMSEISDSFHRKVKITISDTGIGISPSDQVKLFKPYTQAKSSTTRQFGGTGLGLVITKNLCEMMGGEIELKSQVGVGTQMIIKLPLKRSNNELSSSQIEPIGTSDVAINALVVDDVPVNRIVLGNFLKKLGIEVVHASNGREAWDLLKSRKFDVAFLDCYMPEVDGFTCAKEVSSKSQKYHDVILVAVTASTDEIERKRCLECGMKYFLAKPVEFNLLVKILDAIKREKIQGVKHVSA